MDCLLPVMGHMVYSQHRAPSLKVSDEAIAKARSHLSKNEGIECELAGAAGQAALMHENLQEKLLAEGRTIVTFITGSKKD
ncbi:MAG: pyridoxal-phosphate dependent enzyme [Candidatus Altiarchaeales archaeon]|nr:pyridoxal-phosphate dependent enzyme [Candidatus Altiarchaeales archaeon]